MHIAGKGPVQGLQGHRGQSPRVSLHSDHQGIVKQLGGEVGEQGGVGGVRGGGGGGAPVWWGLTRVTGGALGLPQEE